MSIPTQVFLMDSATSKPCSSNGSSGRLKVSALSQGEDRSEPHDDGGSATLATVTVAVHDHLVPWLGMLTRSIPPRVARDVPVFRARGTPGLEGGCTSRRHGIRLRRASETRRTARVLSSESDFAFFLAPADGFETTPRGSTFPTGSACRSLLYPLRRSFQSARGCADVVVLPSWKRVGALRL